MHINVSQAVGQAPMGPFQARVVVLCALIALLDGFDLQAMALVVPHLAAQWNLPVYSFGPVLSASLAGIMLGATTFGILGDRFGRRPVLIATFAAVGLMSVLTAFAETTSALIAVRFLTGVGIGGCLPNFTALTAEYVPSRRQAFGVTVMFSAVPLGSVLGGYFAADLIAAFGWRSVFIVGGAIPLLATAVLYFGLPESIRFMVGSGAQDANVGRILEKIDRSYRYAPEHRFAVEGGAAKSSSLSALFQKGRASTTIALWVVFFFSLFGLYMLTSWLPTVFSQQGWPVAQATKTVSFFWLGGIVGGWVIGWMMDRIGPYRALGAAFVAAAALAASIGLSGSPDRVMALLTLTGFVMVGGQTGATAFAATFYPTSARSTGVGWGLGVGRLGAVISPMLASIALAAHWNHQSLFLAAAVPPLICAATMLVRLLSHRRESGAESAR